MDLNICTVSPGAHDVTKEVRCRANPFPIFPKSKPPTVTLNDLKASSFIWEPTVHGRKVGWLVVGVFHPFFNS